MTCGGIGGGGTYTPLIDVYPDAAVVFLLLFVVFFATISINGVFNVLNSIAYIKLVVSCKLVSGTVLLEIHVNIVHLRAIKQPLKK
jgi:hypothetical protein